MSYLTWSHSYDQSYAWISDELPEEILKKSWMFSFGESLQFLSPDNIIFDIHSMIGGKIFPDSIPNNFNMLVVSKKLKDIFEGILVDFEFYRVRIKDHKKEIINEEYYLAQLLDSHECMDYERSEIKMCGSVKGKVSEIKKLVIDKTRAPKRKKIFRLGEKKDMILVRRDLAQEILHVHQCSGIDFQEIEN